MNANLYRVSITFDGKLRIILSKKDTLLFDGIMEREKDKLKVNKLEVNNNDPFLKLFLNTLIKEDSLTIPQFVNITLSDDKITINQESTFPKMFPCSLILDSTLGVAVVIDPLEVYVGIFGIILSFHLQQRSSSCSAG